MAWYAHTYEKQVRGPWNRWFQVLEPHESETTAHSGLVRADAADDVEWAAFAMNNLPRFRAALEITTNVLQEEIEYTHEYECEPGDFLGATCVSTCDRLVIALKQIERILTEGKAGE